MQALQDYFSTCNSSPKLFRILIGEVVEMAQELGYADFIILNSVKATVFKENCTLPLFKKAPISRIRIKP